MIERDGKWVPASTEEIAPVIAQHINHDGIAYFETCSECVTARKAGKYPHWFGEEHQT